MPRYSGGDHRVVGTRLASAAATRDKQVGVGLWETLGQSDDAVAGDGHAPRLGPSCRRSAPVIGRSNVGPAGGLGPLPDARAVQRCCGQGRPRSAVGDDRRVVGARPSSGAATWERQAGLGLCQTLGQSNDAVARDGHAPCLRPPCRRSAPVIGRRNVGAAGGLGPLPDARAVERCCGRGRPRSVLATAVPPERARHRAQRRGSGRWAWAGC
jgi:hypothetical protein